MYLLRIIFAVVAGVGIAVVWDLGFRGTSIGVSVFLILCSLAALEEKIDKLQ